MRRAGQSCDQEIALSNGDVMCAGAKPFPKVVAVGVYGQAAGAMMKPYADAATKALKQAGIKTVVDGIDLVAVVKDQAELTKARSLMEAAIEPSGRMRAFKPQVMRRDAFNIPDNI